MTLNINKISFTFLMFLFSVSISHAAVFDDTIFRVTFSGDSVNDITTGNTTTGTATDISFVNVTSMPYGNGRGAVFNGSTSSINYGLGAGNELKIEDVFTLHLRVSYDIVNTQTEERLVGRYGLSGSGDVERVWLLQRYPWTLSSIVSRDVGANLRGVSNADYDFKANTFYDIFLRFQAGDATSDGISRLDIYEVGGGHVGYDESYLMSGNLFDTADLDLYVGAQPGGFNPAWQSVLDGTVEQINIWGRAITDNEMKDISGSVSVLETSLFSVTFAGDSVNDVTTGNISVGTSTDITFADVAIMANGNGRAAVFNGATSQINYGLGAGSELKIEGENGLTYHARVKFNDFNQSRFVMARFGDPAATPVSSRVAWIYGEPGGSGRVFGGVSYSGTILRGYATNESALESGVFYDIFMCFKPAKDTWGAQNPGEIQTFIFNAETGRFVGKSDPYEVSFVSLLDSNLISFCVGYRDLPGSEDYLNGLIEQVNVWDRAITENEMYELSGAVQQGLECGNNGLLLLSGDINKDCHVNFNDLVYLAISWLE